MFLVLLAAGVLAALVWARSYAPLEYSGGFSGADTESPLFDRSIVPLFGEEGSALEVGYLLRFRPHSSFRFGFDVYNGGRLPVRIDGIQTTPRTWRGPFRITGMKVQPKPHTYAFDGSRAGSLMIQPDKYGYVIPTLETGARCNLLPGGTNGFNSVRLRYSYLGVFRRSQTVTLPMTIEMTCDDPKRDIGR
jgi:hypothetical protein